MAFNWVIITINRTALPWRSVNPQTDHATFRPKLSVHPTNRLLWQFTTVTFVHLYDPSTYFLSTPPSRWTVCHLWHNIHPPQDALWHHVHPFLKQNLDGLSQHFATHLWRPASCLATCRRFVTGFFPTRLRCPAGFSAKCWRFVALFLDICDVLPTCSSNCGRFVTGSMKKSKKSHETVH
jgi:hypothetical protein